MQQSDGMPGLRGAWLLMNHADCDAGCTVSTLPGNVCFTFSTVVEAAGQNATRETLEPQLNSIHCNLKQELGSCREAVC